MNIRLLKESDFDKLHEAFCLAFSDSEIALQPSKNEFKHRLDKKLNVDYSISGASYDGSDLIGFILHSYNVYEGIPTAYNGGTGVIPGFRNQKTAYEIYEFLLPRIRAKSIVRIILEVVESNEGAIRLYRKLGFVFKRSFRCYKQTSKMDLTHVKEVTVGNMSQVNFSFNDFEPSFGDSEEQLKFGDEQVLVTRKDGEIVGHLIFQPSTGRISQMAVSRIYRSERFGESLLFAAQELSKRPLTIMNVPSGELGMHRFLKKCGFINQVNQLEMELIL
jgi:ribosomal protein S18 acetylase RimI-like enzyme